MVAVYGSLKKGCYNHDILGRPKFLGKSKVNGVMYLNGAYPHLYHLDPMVEREPIDYEVEVYAITPEAHMVVRSMEISAGYAEEILPTAWGDAYVYFTRYDRVSRHHQHITAYPPRKTEA